LFNKNLKKLNKTKLQLIKPLKFDSGVFYIGNFFFENIKFCKRLLRQFPTKFNNIHSIGCKPELWSWPSCLEMSKFRYFDSSDYQSRELSIIRFKYPL